jgi:hypothetical protein
VTGRAEIDGEHLDGVGGESAHLSPLDPRPIVPLRSGSSSYTRQISLPNPESIDVEKLAAKGEVRKLGLSKEAEGFVG